MRLDDVSEGVREERLVANPDGDFLSTVRCGPDGGRNLYAGRHVYGGPSPSQAVSRAVKVEHGSSAVGARDEV